MDYPKFHQALKNTLRQAPRRNPYFGEIFANRETMEHALAFR